ncbi:unnamed protein product [Pylaiella littoralis]
MAQDGIRAQMEAHWRTFDVLAGNQTRGNEAIVRSLGVFEGARGAFTAESAAAAAAAAPQFAANMMFGGQHQPQQPHGGGAQRVSPPICLPRGTANAGASDDSARRAYFRAEEALMLAREQLVRNEETLQRMGEEVERARECISARYNTEEVGSRQQRLDVRARASLQALTRGDSGCAMSPVEMARAMTALLRLHQSEVEMQETIVSGLRYDTPAETVTAYQEALSIRPFMDNRFQYEVQEIRELSQELEKPRTGV